MKILIDIWLDGYESKEDMRKAIIEQFEECSYFNYDECKLLWAEDSKDFDQ